MGRIGAFVARFRNDESGFVAVLVALSLVVLVGFSAMVIDSGVLFVNRTQIQKAVDAAALAGAYDLAPGSAGNKDADAKTYAGYNGVANAEVLGSPDTG